MGFDCGFGWIIFWGLTGFARGLYGGCTRLAPKFHGICLCGAFVAVFIGRKMVTSER